MKNVKTSKSWHGFYLMIILASTIQCNSKSPLSSRDDVSSLYYELEVSIEPSTNGIEGKVIVHNPPDSCFYLNPSFEIQQIMAGDQPVTFRNESTSIPFTVGQAVYYDGSNLDELVIEYTGVIKGVVNGVNMINSNLTELAYYAAWYPIFQADALFDFSLEVNAPSEFVVTTNGKICEETLLDDGRLQTQWASSKPATDIVIVASPHFKEIEQQQNDMSVEFYYYQTPDSSANQKVDRLIRGYQLLCDFYGRSEGDAWMRFVYSPRSGWGYSRDPLFVVSEAYGLSLLNEEFGEARNFHGDVHEMSHFWWNIANTNTPEDWINEGLAEFSAFRLSEIVFGQAFADVLIQEYNTHAAESQTNTAILETESDSPDRYVNRYEKTTLMFLQARERFGEDNLNKVLRALYAEFAGTRDATTGLFLKKVESYMGKEARQYFEETLWLKTWDSEMP